METISFLSLGMLVVMVVVSMIALIYVAFKELKIIPRFKTYPIGMALITGFILMSLTALYYIILFIGKVVNSYIVEFIINQ